MTNRIHLPYRVEGVLDDFLAAHHGLGGLFGHEMKEQLIEPVAEVLLVVLDQLLDAGEEEGEDLGEIDHL